MKTFHLATLLVGVAVYAYAGPAHAETVVTTYVTKVQEERKSTRWTLTEWLKIKERMKMMDVWLAMFSDPKKDRFRPELSVSYALTRGTLQRKSQNVADSVDTEGAQGRVQLWLTNLISSTVGVRTLNVDLGVEGLKRDTARARFSKDGAANTAPASLRLVALTNDLELEGFNHSWYAGSLRIFGKHVQDTSLVLKYGVYASSSDEFSFGEERVRTTIKGRMAGLDFQAYLFKWLGVESSWLLYGTEDDVKGTAYQRGGYYDYLGFLEVSLVRLMVGQYREDWRLKQDPEVGDGEAKVSETGYMGGLKLQF